MIFPWLPLWEHNICSPNPQTPTRCSKPWLAPPGSGCMIFLLLLLWEHNIGSPKPQPPLPFLPLVLKAIAYTSWFSTIFTQATLPQLTTNLSTHSLDLHLLVQHDICSPSHHFSAQAHTIKTWLPTNPPIPALRSSTFTSSFQFAWLTIGWSSNDQNLITIIILPIFTQHNTHKTTKHIKNKATKHIKNIWLCHLLSFFIPISLILATLHTTFQLSAIPSTACFISPPFFTDPMVFAITPCTNQRTHYSTAP